jgi:serine/threonine protein kinase
MQGLFNIIKQGKVEYPKWFSPGAKSLISKMLVVDPKKRMTLEEVCSDPWFVKGGFTRTKTEKIDFSSQDSSAVISDAKEDLTESKKTSNIDPTKP